MPGYTVYCDECDAGYDVYIEENEIHDKPLHCGYCGSGLKEENISSDAEDWDEEDWEKLAEDEWEKDDDSRN
jgi:hypothetical protein